MTYIDLAHAAVHIVLVLLLPPLLLGVIAKTKALVAGRVGPPWLQAYYDLVKLLRKGIVLSSTTTWIFRAGPTVALVTSLTAALLVPLGGHRAPLACTGDFVLLAYVMGLGRFFTIAAALDTGSSFEGMGGAREATFSCLAEPALFFAFLVLVKASGGSLSLSDHVDALHGAMVPGMLGERVVTTWATSGAALVAISASVFVVVLVENCRIPFDDPNTHLELTMIHEVMVLDHGGPLLGLIQYAASIKLFVYGSVFLGIAAPLGAVNEWIAWPAFVATLLVLAIVIGVVESVIARLRLVQLPNLLLAACLMSAFGALLVRVT
jgi:formate hydrogenlyase subunit 4